MFRLTLLYLVGLACSQVSANQAVDAIIGGHYAKKGDFKYHVYILSGGCQCGGAILNDNFVLTAAHCVTDEKGHFRMRRLAVILGTHDLNELHDRWVTHAIAAYIPKNYRRDENLNDIALLKLAHHLQLSHHHQRIAKINLPKPDGHYENKCAVIAGYGDQEIRVRKNSHGELEEYGGKTDDKLKFTSVRMISNKRCEELNEFQVPNTIICGQALQEDKHHFSGVCAGDSGGPLVYEDEVIGILSLSPKGCNEARMASMYTRVASYLNFIHEVMGGHLGNDVAWTHLPD